MKNGKYGKLDKFVLSKFGTKPKIINLYGKLRIVLDITLGYVLKAIILFEIINYFITGGKISLWRQIRYITLISISTVFFIYFYKKYRIKIFDLLNKIKKILFKQKT